MAAKITARRPRERQVVARFKANANPAWALVKRRRGNKLAVERSPATGSVYRILHDIYRVSTFHPWTGSLDRSLLKRNRDLRARGASSTEGDSVASEAMTSSRGSINF